MIIEITVPKNSDDAYYKSICEGFKKKYGDDTRFEKKTDKKLIGGFRALVGGTVYDTSIRTKLDRIKKVITE